VPGLSVREVLRCLLDLWLETDALWWSDFFMLEGVAARPS
jgi:hypothetical protein